MTREEALALVGEHTKNKNLVRHMVAVEVCMRALAAKLDGDTEIWGLAGLLHDVDYETVKDDNPKEKHIKLAIEWLSDKDVPEEVLVAIRAHGWGYVEGMPEPSNPMEWALYACDELTGFIVAVALVKGGKISEVEVSSVLKKWKQKGFAAGVHREQIEFCEEKLGIKLPEFIEICLVAMQNIKEELGLS